MNPGLLPAILSLLNNDYSATIDDGPPRVPRVCLTIHDCPATILAVADSAVTLLTISNEGCDDDFQCD